MKKLLEVEDLTISFSMYDKSFSRKIISPIKGLSLDLYEEEILAVVGASGSGKSLLAHTILGILPKNAVQSGVIRYNGVEVTEANIQGLRRDVFGFIPQSVNYLDPLRKVEKYVSFREGEYLDLGLDRGDYKKLTFELSGGMSRRVLLGSSLKHKKKIIIADEPTPGLSYDLAMYILNTLRELAKNNGASIMLITHDIDLVSEYADRMSIFYDGRILETISAALFNEGDSALRHPYTKALRASLPQNGFKNISIAEIQEQCREMQIEGF
jgi:ABC-type dipeptide/oligopeptide/nickel transport system ATPase component